MFSSRNSFAYNVRYSRGAFSFPKQKSPVYLDSSFFFLAETEYLPTYLPIHSVYYYCLRIDYRRTRFLALQCSTFGALKKYGGTENLMMDRNMIDCCADSYFIVIYVVVVDGQNIIITRAARHGCVVGRHNKTCKLGIYIYIYMRPRAL